MKLGKFIEDKGADKITIIAVDWLEGRYGGGAAQLDRVLRRVIHPRMYAVRGTDETSRLFGGIDSVPAFFLYDRNGKLVLSMGGPAEEQSRNSLDAAILERVIAGK